MISKDNIRAARLFAFVALGLIISFGAKVFHELVSGP